MTHRGPISRLARRLGGLPPGSRVSVLLLSVALSGVALTAGAVAVVGGQHPGPLGAQASERLPPFVSRMLARGGSCPLAVGTQIEAVQAFAEMLPVFRHPRCLNCHGGMDVLSDAHPGASALDDALDPRTSSMTSEFRAKFEPQCQDCHDGLEGWTVPGQPLFFVDKDDATLCRQMKSFGNDTGEKFVSHIFDDHGGIQFIATGFAGDRALGPDGLAENHLSAQPPPGTQSQLTAKARRWVDVMGAQGGWVGDPSCGCEMPRIRLKVHHRSEDNRAGVSARTGWAAFSGDAEFEVTLTAVRVDPAQRRVLFRGEASLVRQLQVYYRAAECRGPISEAEDWLFFGEVRPESNTMTLKFAFSTSDERGSVVCTSRGSTFNDELDLSLFTELSEIEVPLDSGTTRRATATAPGNEANESIEITVLDVG
jgi:hypothetical protein